MHEQEPESPVTLRRVIKRYANRKLYDTRDSRYVTLLQVAELLREGEDVQIIDNATKEDKTDVTLALIISEELKARPRAIPVATLKALVRHGGERLLTSLRGGPIGKLMPAPGAESASPSSPGHPAPDRSPEPAEVPEPEDSPPAAVASEAPHPGAFKRTLDQWQASIDARLSAILPAFTALGDLQNQIKSISDRLENVERAIEERAEAPAPEKDGASERRE